MAADPRRILVVRAGALGDTLMATPVLPALAARHPGAAIDFLASAAAAPLLEQHPLLRRVYRLRWRNLPYALSLEQRRLVRAWRREPYDVAVVLEQAPQYRALVERAGPARVLGFHVTPFDPARHSIVNNLRAAGIAEPCAPPDMALPLSPADLTRADALVGGAGEPLAGLHAGYGPARWRRKQQQEARLRGWPAERFAAVGRALAARGYRIVLTGSAADRRLVRRIAARLPPETTIDLAGRTGPRELAAVIARLAVLVSVDSGPAHMAAAVGTP
ncbi:MAG TPA: glycosyltransferase family 9 protein, partial [Vicinamibacterales bacterium]|nr:glycosyltransferase family 9 protein [Vicinamibacterales bacterium]